MKMALEFDDFSPKNTNFGLLEELVEHYPKIKITMFTVAWEIRWGDQTAITLPQYKPFCDAVKKAVDQGWLEIAVHGLTHHPAEFAEISHDEARKRVIIAEKMFANRGIPITKIFKAPFWQLSKRGEQAITELGYYVAKDGYYNWNLRDDMPTDQEVILAHGHVQNTTGNGLEEIFPKLLKIPTDTEFMFLSEWVQKYGKK